jgi:hypothetical protein
MNLLTNIGLTIQGFNASLYPSNDEYLGVIRRQKILKNQGYPEVINTSFFFTLDKSMKLIDFKEIYDKTGRKTHMNYTAGIEDFRWIDETSGVATTLDTNGCWKTEVSYIELDINKNIIKVLPLRFGEQPTQNEKNWIPLQKSEKYLDLIYSMNPVTIIRADLENGKCTILKKEQVTHFQEPIHNGACYKYNDTYIVAVRVKERHHYKNSFLIQMDRDFSIIKISKPFRFTEDKEYRTCDSPSYKPGPYEMCMTLIPDKDTLITALSVDDKNIFIIKYSIQSIIDFINDS